MRLSQHFGRTLRDAPSDASMTSHKLVVRAGLARPLEPGIWSYLSLGWRVIRQLESILRAEMEAIGAEEVHLPISHPSDRDSAGGAAREEIMAELCSREIESYKDLPRAIYQFQTSVRDEPHPRGGLIRLREYLAQDTYSMHADADDPNAFYSKIYQAYLTVFGCCDLEVIPVEADTELAGGNMSHEFMLPHPGGEDRFVSCDACGYAANIDTAAFERGEMQSGDLREMEKVATPGCKTIADLCKFLNVEAQQTLKAVFYTIHANTTSERTILAMLRGDLEISEAKLMRVLDVSALEPATESQIQKYTGAIPGYASPIGLHVRSKDRTDGTLVIGDESLSTMSNFVTGANDAGYHVVNASYPRDFEVTQIADIAEAFEGATCARCGEKLQTNQAIKLGYCSKAGIYPNKLAGATYLDANNQTQPLITGSYGIGLDRLLAAIIEMHHDEHGIIWPPDVSPFDVHLVALARDESAAQIAESLYADLRAVGIETLYDDRNLSPGVMFADADLIGIPLRLTVSQRSLSNGGIEIKWRHQDERIVLPLEGIVEQIRTMLSEAQQRRR